MDRMRKMVQSATLIEELRERSKKSSQKHVAEEIGITPQFLSDVLSGRREVTSRIANAMGYWREIVFVKVRKP